MVFSVQTFISTFIFIVSLPSCLSSNHASIPALSGFSAKIIDRNSPHLPFYNPNLTRFDRIKAYFLRSHTNAASPNTIDTPLRYTDSQYVMEYYIGTPPVLTYGVLDTGSSLTWLQCEPCEKCYRQTKPIFDSRKSSTYNQVSCKDYMCLKITGANRCTPNGKCPYGLNYADNTYTVGILAQETLIFDNDGTNVTRPYVIVGCGHKNTNLPNAREGIPGIIGLNTGSASILRQLSYKDFSYCFGDYQESKKHGYVKFGDKSIIKGSKTPFVDNHAHYYLILEGITVNRFRLPIPKDAFTVKNPYSYPPTGGFVIDSGATATYLNRTAYNILVGYLDGEFKKWKKARRRSDAEHQLGFPFCYEFIGWVTQKFIPVLTFHFTNADLQLPTRNTWIHIQGDIYCLVILPSDGLSFLGNFQMQNFDIGYDLQNKVVSFDYTNCKDGELKP